MSGLISKRRGQGLPILVTGLCLLGLLAPQACSASIRCHFSPGNHVLSVTASDFSAATLQRVGDEIQVSGFGIPVPCRGTATVVNTDRVKILVKEEGAARIELSGGPYAPGATPEADHSSEIEFSVTGPGYARVTGGPGRDHFQYMKSEGYSGVNLNSDEDEDLDVAVTQVSIFSLFVVGGGKGADTIDVVGNPALFIFADGEGGNDTISAGPSGSILEGGRGRDTLIGSPAFDLIDPGGGADRVKAGGGGDEVEVRSDGRRDRIDCGGGRDRVAVPDRHDRLRGCERVKGRR